MKESTGFFRSSGPFGVPSLPQRVWDMSKHDTKKAKHLIQPPPQKKKTINLHHGKTPNRPTVPARSFLRQRSISLMLTMLTRWPLLEVYINSIQITADGLDNSLGSPKSGVSSP